MTISRDQKFALRKGAPASTKLSVSRPARRVNMVGVKRHAGVGNVTSYVQSMTAEMGVSLDRQEMSYLVARVNKAYDQSGRIPGAFDINRMIGD
jgi:hypothetical protein